MSFSENNLLMAAVQAAIEAGKKILEVYNSKFDVEYKEDDSPLTLADKISNETINSFLEKTEINILSEEGMQIDYTIRKNWNKVWIVDPLDGTKEFVKKNGEFTVNIALVENTIPVLGVIYAPVLNELYFAIKSNGAYYQNVSSNVNVNEIVDKATLLEKHVIKNNNIRVVASRSHMSDETINYIKNLEQDGFQTELVSKGSALKFGLIAKNKADVYPRFAPTMEWDTAAGQIIIEEVGKILIDNETGLPMRYNRKQLRNNWFLVK